MFITKKPLCESLIAAGLGIILLVLANFSNTSWLNYLGATMFIPSILYGIEGKKIKYLRAKKNPRPIVYRN